MDVPATAALLTVEITAHPSLFPDRLLDERVEAARNILIVADAQQQLPVAVGENHRVVSVGLTKRRDAAEQNVAIGIGASVVEIVLDTQRQIDRPRQRFGIALAFLQSAVDLFGLELRNTAQVAQGLLLVTRGFLMHERGADQGDQQDDQDERQDEPFQHR